MIFRLSDMQRVAHEGRYAIPHFLGCTLEMTLGAIRAAEELNAPIAFGVAPEVFASVPLAYVFPMLLNAARQTSVPVAVQLEHGNGYAQAAKAISLGVDSVMYDGSALDYEQNVRNSAAITEMAHAFGACVEAELGHVGGSAVRTVTEGLVSHSTDPALVRDFIDRTQVDTLAISFGNVHGNYRGQAQIDTELVRRIDALAGIPLVMHGGSGLPDEAYPPIVAAGISNIHFYTGICKYAWGAVAEQVADLSDPPYHEVTAHLIDFFTERTAHVIRLLGAADRAGDFRR